MVSQNASLQPERKLQVLVSVVCAGVGGEGKMKEQEKMEVRIDREASYLHRDAL
jgi:hypothetical protein